MTPGSLNGAATDILQEGLRMNYLKLDKSGWSELLRLILDNVRATAEATADFHAVLGICRVAERRLREAIAALSPGEYCHVGYLDGNEAHSLAESYVNLIAAAGSTARTLYRRGMDPYPAGLPASRGPARAGCGRASAGDTASARPGLIT